MEHVFYGSAASNAISKVNRALIVHFVEAMKTTNFRAHSYIGKLHVMQFIK